MEQRVQGRPAASTAAGVRWYPEAASCDRATACTLSPVTMSKARLEAFSDGVIAVAITLLALDLTVPEPGHGLAADAARRPLAAVRRVCGELLHHRDHLGEPPRAGEPDRPGRPDIAVHQSRAPDVRRPHPIRHRDDGHVSHQRAQGFAHRDGVYAVVLEGMALSFTAMFEWSLREGRTYVTVPMDQRRNARVRTSIRHARVRRWCSSLRSSARRFRLRIAGVTAVYYIFAPVPTSAVAGTDVLERGSQANRDRQAAGGQGSQQCHRDGSGHTEHGGSCC